MKTFFLFFEKALAIMNKTFIIIGAKGRKELTK